MKEAVCVLTVDTGSKAASYSVTVSGGLSVVKRPGQYQNLTTIIKMQLNSKTIQTTQLSYICFTTDTT